MRCIVCVSAYNMYIALLQSIYSLAFFFLSSQQILHDEYRYDPLDINFMKIEGNAHVNFEFSIIDTKIQIESRFCVIHL